MSAARVILSVEQACERNAALIPAVAGRVVCLFSGDCQATHDQLETWAACGTPPSTLVTLEWERAPRLSDELDETVTALGQAVLTLSPALYASARQRGTDASWLDARSHQTRVELVVSDAVRHVPAVTAVAARSILRDCAASKPPLLRGLPGADRIRQLALALDPEQLVIELLVHEPELPPPGALLAFAKGAEWLARNSGARVIAVVREELAACEELEAVSYGARRWAREPAASEPVVPAPVTRARKPDQRAAVLPDSTETDVPLVSVGAVIGRPHPGSAAELLLHARLTADSELGPLFSYNQLVQTRHGATPRVDVVWPEGGLAIEIDGHRDHARRGKFGQDRERDYYLLVSGYRVLRVLDQLVLSDVGLVLERIRTAVRYLKQENHER